MTADPDPVTEAQFLGGWGDLLDPNALGGEAPDALAERILRVGIHDFVWTGDDD
jgi:hypothetical protein